MFGDDPDVTNVNLTRRHPRDRFDGAALVETTSLHADCQLAAIPRTGDNPDRNRRLAVIDIVNPPSRNTKVKRRSSAGSESPDHTAKKFLLQVLCRLVSHDMLLP